MSGDMISELRSANHGLKEALDSAHSTIGRLESELRNAKSDASAAWARTAKAEAAAKGAEEAARDAEIARRETRAAKSEVAAARAERDAQERMHGDAVRRATQAEQTVRELRKRLDEQFSRPDHVGCAAVFADLRARLRDAGLSADV